MLELIKPVYVCGRGCYSDECFSVHMCFVVLKSVFL